MGSRSASHQRLTVERGGREVRLGTGGWLGANRRRPAGILLTNEGQPEALREIVGLITINSVYYANRIMSCGNIWLKYRHFETLVFLGSHF